MGRKKVLVESRFWGMGNREKKGSLANVNFVHSRMLGGSSKRGIKGIIHRY